MEAGNDLHKRTEPSKKRRAAVENFIMRKESMVVLCNKMLMQESNSDKMIYDVRMQWLHLNNVRK